MQPSSSPAVPRPGTPPRVVFLLACERSGSTLARVMLSAHPQLFCPPELNLLSFETLEDRRWALPEPQRFGLDHAWMEATGVSAAEARAALDAWEKQGRSTLELYESLMARIDARKKGQMLVDKSPLYSRDPEGLRRAEAYFGERARYIYLTRHPLSVVDSLGRIMLERLSTQEGPNLYYPFEMAEEGWALSNQTILDFLGEIDDARQCRLRFEDLVASPREELERILRFLGLSFCEETLDPHRFGEMTTSPFPDALVGDPAFLKRARIERDLGDAWRALSHPLKAVTIALAGELGYVMPSSVAE